MIGVMKLLGLLALVSLCIIQNVAAEKEWWEVASFYQIYPRSFKDSSGDGVGDLKGITEQLPYLKEIGITATWLSPIFTSPMADFGYDIANFYDVDPIFGTMEDLENLIAKGKEIGVKIILDFVPNHSSDECEWFIKSIEKDPEYADFYVWHPGKIIDGVRHPPNNWISVFRGSMWTWNDQRQEYYMHQFHAKQPDFNYRNPKVREEMKEILRFWLRKGVAGFRIDAVPHVFEIAPDEEGNWPDEPRNEAVEDPEDYNYLQHIYTVDQPETIELVYEFRQVLDEIKIELGGDERIIMTEAYTPINVAMQYYGNSTHNGSHIPFNFELISNLNENSTASFYKYLIDLWLDNMPEGRTANWVLGNHDQKRIGSRIGVERIDLINILLATLPGCSVTYQGEEIGMVDVWISWEDTVDPQGCQSNPDEYERLSRDPVRSPFQWNDLKNAGFSNGNETWLPVGDNYQTVNVKRERGVAISHLNIYKQLRNLRDTTTMQEGNTQVEASTNDNVLIIKRSLPGQPTFIILLNINDKFENINLNNLFSDLSNKLEYLLVTDRSIKKKGDKVSASSIHLLPYEGAILTTIS